MSVLKVSPLKGHLEGFWGIRRVTTRKWFAFYYPDRVWAQKVASRMEEIGINPKSFTESYPNSCVRV